MYYSWRLIINQVKQKLHLVGYLLIQYFKDARYHEHKILPKRIFAIIDMAVIMYLLVKPFVLRHFSHLKKAFIGLVGRDSDSLQAGRSGDRIPVWDEIFRTCPDRPWGPPSLLYNRYRVSFLGIKMPGRGVDHPPHPAPRLTSNPPLYLRSMLWATFTYNQIRAGICQSAKSTRGWRPGFHWRQTQVLFQTDSTAHTDFYPLRTFRFIAGVKAPGEWSWPPTFVCRWG